MDTIPLSALQEIVRRGVNGPVYRHEYVKMAAELIELRERFNKREDLSLRAEGDLPASAAAQWGNSIRSRLHAMKDGDTLIIPGTPGWRFRVVKEAYPWSPYP